MAGGASPATGVARLAVNGEAMPVGEWPGVVRVDRAGTTICTGTLIGPRHVLTAMHCYPAGHVNIDVGLTPEGRPLCANAPILAAACYPRPPEEPDCPHSCQRYCDGACRFNRDCSTGRRSTGAMSDVAVLTVGEWSGAEGIDLASSLLPLFVARTNAVAASRVGGSRMLQLGYSGIEGDDPTRPPLRALENGVDRVQHADVSETFLTTAGFWWSSLAEGDSGGPLVLFEDGRPFVAGAAKFADGYTVLLRSGVDWVRSVMLADYGGDVAAMEAEVPWLRDADGDGVSKTDDNCPTVSNGDQTDFDEDGVGDACDNCWEAPNPNQTETLVATTVRTPWGTELEGRLVRDAPGDACDLCPATLDARVGDNANGAFELAWEFSPDDQLADACDPDPFVVVPDGGSPTPAARVVGRSSSGLWVRVRSGDRWGVPLRRYGFDDTDRTRRDPMRAMWCSCWDPARSEWLDEARCSDRDRCNQDGRFPSEGEVEDRIGWYDLTWWSAPFYAIPSLPCATDAVDWDGDGDTLECVPPGYPSGVRWERHGRVGDVEPAVARSYWSWYADRARRNPGSGDSRCDGDACHAVSLWLRADPIDPANPLMGSGIDRWSERVRSRLGGDPMRVYGFNNTYVPRVEVGYEERWVVDRSLLLRVPYPRLVPADPFVPAASAADGTKVRRPVLIPVDEELAPLPAGLESFRYPDPGAEPVLAGLAVGWFVPAFGGFEAIVPSRAAAGGSVPAGAGFAAVVLRPAGGAAIEPPPGLAGAGGDALRGDRVRVAVFGGRDAGGGFSSDLWMGEDAAALSIREPEGSGGSWGESFFEWTRMVPRGQAIPPGREGAALLAGTDGESVLLLGGIGVNGPLSDAWRFDFRLEEWAPVSLAGAPLPAGAWAGVEQVGTRAFLVAGRADAAVTERLVRVDVDTGSVRPTVTLGGPAGRTAWQPLALPGGRSLSAFGGVDEWGWHNDLWRLDLDTVGLPQWRMVAPDCTVGECPVAGPGNAALFDAASTEVIAFSPWSARGDPYYRWDGAAWMSARAALADPLAGDCDDDGTPEAAYGRLCAAGTSWWDVPGRIGCAAATAAPGCSGGSAGGGLAAEHRVPGLRAVALEDRVAVVAAGTGLEVLDIGDPFAPRSLGSLRFRAPVRDVRTAGGIAYVAVDSELAVVDVRNPARPRVLARVPACGSARGVALLGNGSVAVDTPTGVSIVDVRVPATAELASRLWLLPVGRRGWTPVVTSGRACGVLSFAAELACRLLGRCGGNAGVIDGEGTQVYVGRGDALLVIDAASPAAPGLSATVRTGREIGALRGDGGIVYVNGTDGSRAVVDATAAPPALAGTHDVGAWVEGVRFSDGVACRVVPGRLETAVTDAP